MFGFFQGSVNSGNWAKTENEEQQRKKAKRVRLCRIMFDVADSKRLWKVFVDIFAVQETNKHESTFCEYNADPIIPDTNAVVVAAAF